MRRREIITFMVSTAASSLAPLAARAQRADKPPVIGLLVPGASPSVFRPTADLVERRLGELGWIEGRNVIVEYRYAEGSLERAAEIAAEFVRMKVDVIVTLGDTQVLAVKRATSTIPIVMVGAGDPVGNGLVASLARPGGNVTGISSAVNETAGKRLELLRDVVPGLKRVAVLGHFANSLVGAERDAVLAAAHTLGLDTVQSAFRTEDDIAPAIESLNGRAEALYVCFDLCTPTRPALTRRRWRCGCRSCTLLDFSPKPEVCSLTGPTFWTNSDGLSSWPIRFCEGLSRLTYRSNGRLNSTSSSILERPRRLG